MRSLVLFLTSIRMALFVIFFSSFTRNVASKELMSGEGVGAGAGAGAGTSAGAGNEDMARNYPECEQYSHMKPNMNLDIPKRCCDFGTEECYFTHNGECRLHSNTTDCDYTIDECHTKYHGKPISNIWYCTCCASCDGKYAKNECKMHGGSCRVKCQQDEVSAAHQCSSDHCKCCKKPCPNVHCASGEGFCVSESSECQGRHYIDRTDVCVASSCSCCKACGTNLQCDNVGGFCEWYSRPCPKGFTEDRDKPCNSIECRCCKPEMIVDGSELTKQNQAMEADIPQNP